MVSVKVIEFMFLGVCLLAANTSEARCCHGYSPHKMPFNVIEGYSLQIVTEKCPGNAIIFHTKKGRHICTDPALSWVMDYVNRLRAKAQRVHHQNTSKA